MRKRCRAGREGGFSLIEVLVALVIIAMALAGSSAILANAISRQRELECRLEAETLLDGILARPDQAEGTGEYGTGECRLEWEIRKIVLATGQMGGVRVEWFQLGGEVTWQWRGRSRQVNASVVRVGPMQASP